ncbi:MAG: glycosyltransferase [Magnetospirillum sp.]|nr:glycosyltransferase [Magnetospirillum sp.]
MRILQVNTFDSGGGAEAVVSRLHRAYCRAGHDARVAVKRKCGDESGVFAIPEGAGSPPLSAALLATARAVESLRLPGTGLGGALLRRAARPGAACDRWRGFEDFRYPSTRLLPDLGPAPAELLHLHNLHGGYFDLAALPDLSARVPVVWTLHDCWPFAGHCAHSFACGRWRSGCGDCPDLTIYPALDRDGTAANWARKRAVFARSRLYLATPSEWLMARARESMLWPAVVEAKVIHNGVDDAFFAAPARLDARRALGLAEDAAVLLFAANSIRANEWKDFATLRVALGQLGEGWSGRSLLLIALGEAGETERLGAAELRFVPFETDARRVARWFSAADLYLHASKVETFSLTIAEAMACGTPVVATEAGAVAERIRDLGSVGADTATGVLVAAGDAQAMAAAARRLLTDDGLAVALGNNARAEAERLYRMERQAAAYLTWFSAIRAGHPSGQNPQRGYGAA